MQKPAEGTHVAAGDRCQHAVDALEKPIFFAVLTAQQERGERGRESKRVEGGDGNREGDGQCELAEQNARGAGKEGYGREDGAGDFLHGVGRGFDGIGLAFLQMALDVFDDDDGVVDYEARGERDAEQGQGVDGEAEQLDESERADERDWDGDRGDDGGAPVFEENEDDKDDEEDGLAEGRDYVANGFADGVGGIEGELILHAGRKAFGKAVEFGDAAAVHVEGVGGGELSDADANRFVSAVVQVGAVVFGPKLGVADIAQTDESAIGIALEDDVIELTGFRKTADGADADLELLAGKSRLRTDLSGGDFNVLLLQSAHHIVGGKGTAGHAH